MLGCPPRGLEVVGLNPGSDLLSISQGGSVDLQFKGSTCSYMESKE